MRAEPLGAIYVDLTHCGRHVTGLERIALELFSHEALAPLATREVRAKDRRAMVLAQMVGLPLKLLRDGKAIALCPGFPPTPPLAAFGARVLPYIHDVFLITRPGDLNRRAKFYMAPSFRHAVRKLPRFLVNSEHTARELRGFARDDAEIRLYRPQVRNVFGLEAGARAGRRGGPLRLVAVGTVEPRKNLQAAGAILAALRAKGEPEATLDIVGRHGWGDDATRLAAMPGVTLHGYQPGERMRELIEAADMLISTSHDEGLGLPLLEAQFAGLAVVAPEAAVFREVLGESGILVATADPAAAAERILAVAARADWRQEAAAGAQKNLARWNAAAASDREGVVALVTSLAAGVR